MLMPILKTVKEAGVFESFCCGTAFSERRGKGCVWPLV